MGTTSLVLEPKRFAELLEQATVWADRFTLALVAPHSEHGAVPAWAHLLDAHAKAERILVSHAGGTEGWLLHRLHETGTLSLVESLEHSFSSNVLAFRRGGELRCFLAPAPLSRATLETDCGVVLAYDGALDSDFAADCTHLLDNWRKHSRVPSGSEIDNLSTALPDSAPVLPEPPAQDCPLSIVTERNELASALQSVWAMLDGLRVPAGAHEPPFDPEVIGSQQTFSFGAQGSLHVSVLPDGCQLQIDGSADSAVAPAVVLSLVVGDSHAKGNALVVREGGGASLFVWRGGLLGAARRKNAVLWSHARLTCFDLMDDECGGQQRVALVARLEQPLAPQLIEFAREVRRLRELFPIDPPEPADARSVAFDQLPFDEQTTLLWETLIGLGSLQVDEAVATAALSLRDQGYVQYQRLRRDGSLYRVLADVLVQCARAGTHFDRPRSGEVRAIQTDVDAYTREDWLECLTQALPERETIDRAAAMRLVFDYAREHWGLSAQRLRSGGKVENALKSTLNSAVRRGLIRRVGAAYLEKVEPGRRSMPVEAAVVDVSSEQAQHRNNVAHEPQLGEALPIIHEALPTVDEAPFQAEPAVPHSTLHEPLLHLGLPVRTLNWAERQRLVTVRDLVAWHPDVFAEQNNIGRLTVAQTRGVLEKAIGTEWEDAWAALDEPKTHPESEEVDSSGSPLPPPEQSLWNQRLAQLTPEQQALPLSRLALPGRVRTYCEQHGLNTVGELLAISRDELLSQPNLGRTSLIRTLEVLEEALQDASSPVMDESFLAGWQGQLRRLATMPRLIVSMRSGLHGARETLETVGEMLGVTRERIRQIEVQSLEQIAQRTSWAQDLRTRLEQAFGGGRCIPLPLLIESDPWWRGVEMHVPLLEYVFERLLGASVFCLELDREGQTELVISRFDRARLNAVEKQLLDAAAEVETPAPLSAYEQLVDAAARDLDPALRGYLRAAIDERLNFDERDAERVASFGSTKNDQVIALLESQAEPVHVSTVYEAIGRCRFPDEVLYFRRGVVGLEKHFPDFQSWTHRLVPRCVELMQQLPAGRQWLVPELHQTLAEANELPDWLGHWHLASILRRSGLVQYLGRLRVALHAQGTGAERIHHQDAARVVLEEAGAPLPFGLIAERIRQRTDVHDATLHIMLLSSPFVKLAEDSYGLVARDVPGGPEAIAQAVEAVVQTLEVTERGLTGHQAFQLATGHVGEPWSAELVTSLLRSEPQLRLARSGNVGLAAWDDVRTPNRGEFIRQHVERGGGQVSVASLQDALANTYGRPLDRGELTTECHRSELRLEGELVVTRVAPSPSNTTEAPDLDLTGRVGGIPAAARQHFEALLRHPLEPPPPLLDRARAHLADLERAGSQNEFVEVSLARRLLELYERLLAHASTLSPTTQRIAQAAVLYFISTDDAEDDFELAGLDDDKAVLDAVLKHLELDWS